MSRLIPSAASNNEVSNSKSAGINGTGMGGSASVVAASVHWAYNVSVPEFGSV